MPGQVAIAAAVRKVSDCRHSCSSAVPAPIEVAATRPLIEDAFARQSGGTSAALQRREAGSLKHCLHPDGSTTTESILKIRGASSLRCFIIAIVADYYWYQSTGSVDQRSSELGATSPPGSLTSHHRRRLHPRSNFAGAAAIITNSTGSS